MDKGEVQENKSSMICNGIITTLTRVYLQIIVIPLVKEPHKHYILTCNVLLFNEKIPSRLIARGPTNMFISQKTEIK